MNPSATAVVRLLSHAFDRSPGPRLSPVYITLPRTKREFFAPFLRTPIFLVSAALVLTFACSGILRRTTQFSAASESETVRPLARICSSWKPPAIGGDNSFEQLLAPGKQPELFCIVQAALQLSLLIYIVTDGFRFAHLLGTPR